MKISVPATLENRGSTPDNSSSPARTVPPMNHQELQRYLSRTAARKVRLRLTDDRRELLEARSHEGQALNLTVHGLILDAPRRVIRALAGFVQEPVPERRRKVIRLYRGTGLDRAGDRSPGGRRVTLRHAGARFDLKAVYDRLNGEYFDGTLHAFITWGRRTRRRGARSIHFGSYNWERRLIRVNPLLDRGFVPRYFVDSVVYHEMLHAALGVRAGRDGGIEAHTAEFRRREAGFRHAARARVWERRHLHRFLTRES